MIKVFKRFYSLYFSEEEAIILTVLLVLFFTVVMTLGSIIAPLLWSLVITYLLQGLAGILTKFHMPRRLAVLVVYAMFLGLTILTMLVVLPFTWNHVRFFINDLPSTIEKLRSLFLLLPEHYPDVFTAEQVQSWLSSMQLEIRKLRDGLLSYSFASLPRLVAFTVYAVLVPIMVFFMLKDSEKLLNWFETWLPEKRPIMAQIWHEMNDQLGNYIRGKALEILIVGTASFMVYFLLGLNYPFVLAVLTGMSVIIPFLGAAFVTIPIFLVAFFEWGFGSELYQVMIAYLVLQFVDGNILVPLLFSETVNLHPIAILTAVLVFGGIWGLWGVFFAIPLATFVKAIMRAWPVSKQHIFHVI